MPTFSMWMIWQMLWPSPWQLVQTGALHIGMKTDRIHQMWRSVHETRVRLTRHLVHMGGYAQGALALHASCTCTWRATKFSAVDLDCRDPDRCTLWSTPMTPLKHQLLFTCIRDLKRFTSIGSYTGMWVLGNVFHGSYQTLILSWFRPGLNLQLTGNMPSARQPCVAHEVIFMY